ncbi:MAG: peroxiredoxin [Bacteroidales bacterium]|nr:peroxiredoxin [Bacteroidales bacterium]
MKKAIVISCLITAAVLVTTAQVSLGEKVPNFTTLDHEGSKWALKKQLKSADYLVVYFYPAAFTGGCTKQACTYRDQKGDLAAVNAQVVGVSGDKPETLGLFALEHQLNFTLLADESGEIARIFGVPQKEGGTIQREIKGKTLDLARGTTIQRWTFILDRKGTLIYKDSEVNATEDSSKVVEFLSSL